MKTSLRRPLLLVALAAGLLAPAARGGDPEKAAGQASGGPSRAPEAKDLPGHPREIRYPDLVFAPPRPADFRFVLPNGLVCYLVPDRAIPALRIQAKIRAGELWVPKEKRGLAKLAGRLLRNGGSGELSARELDARLDHIAAEIATSFDLDRGRASLFALSAHAEEALALFSDVLLRPRFDADRIRRANDALKEEVAHRDDDPEELLERRFAEALYGDYPAAWHETAETIDRITREEIAGFCRRHVRPETVILAVSGDFERGAMERELARLFGKWKGEGEPPRLCVPPLAPRTRAEVVLVDRETSQGFVQMGHATVPLDHADLPAIQVMNFILGGGSFTSRVTARVRNDEGLAYSAGSYFAPERDFPGSIGLYYQTKTETVAYAAKICLDEVRRLRQELVAPEELLRATRSLCERFPDQFATAARTAEALSENEFLGRPEDYLSRYRDRIAAVTAEDVRRAARAHLDPGRFVLVAVGPASELAARDEARGCALADLEAEPAAPGPAPPGR